MVKLHLSFSIAGTNGNLSRLPFSLVRAAQREDGDGVDGLRRLSPPPPICPPPTAQRLQPFALPPPLSLGRLDPSLPRSSPWSPPTGGGQARASLMHWQLKFVKLSWISNKFQFVGYICAQFVNFGIDPEGRFVGYTKKLILRIILLWLFNHKTTPND